MHTTLQTLLAAGAGGALGAMIRVGFVTFAVPGPFGIFVLNVVGALALGVVMGAEGKGPLLTVFLGGGLLGALTTFSTFAGDAVKLGSAQPLVAGLYIAASVTVAILAFILGSSLGRAL
ncbi:MAG: CrcB family protein [Planctomycetota bacterium]